MVDAALRNLGHNLYTDGLIDRTDMISLLRNAEDGGIIDSAELADLRAIAANTSLFGTASYVDVLATYIVSGNTANAKYPGSGHGQSGGELDQHQMEHLIGKWYSGAGSSDRERHLSPSSGQRCS